MKLFYFVFLLILSFYIPSIYSNDSFKKYWVGQGAEITRYELQQSRYGQIRKGDAVLIYVTEPFNTQQQIKSDQSWGENVTTVLKLNHTRNFLTGLYPYSIMSSTFHPTDTQTYKHALKTNLSIQEWCGHVFEQWNSQSQHWNMKLFSYFQSEGELELKFKKVWLEDELWTLIRLDPKQCPTGEFEILAGGIYRRLYHKKPTILKAVGQWVQKGAKHQEYHLKYSNLDRELKLTIQKEFPFQLEAFWERTGQNQTTAKATHRKLSPYWSQNSNQDREKRKELGLKP